VVQLLGALDLPVLQDVPMVTMRLAEIKDAPWLKFATIGKSHPRLDIEARVSVNVPRSFNDTEILKAGEWHERVAPSLACPDFDRRRHR